MIGWQNCCAAQWSQPYRYLHTAWLNFSQISAYTLVSHARARFDFAVSHSFDLGHMIRMVFILAMPALAQGLLCWGLRKEHAF